MALELFYLLTAKRAAMRIALNNFMPRQKNTWVVFGTGKAPSA